MLNQLFSSGTIVMHLLVTYLVLNLSFSSGTIPIVQWRFLINHSVVMPAFCWNYTLSGRIGKVVASHAAVARSCPAEVALIYTMHVALRVYCP